MCQQQFLREIVKRTCRRAEWNLCRRQWNTNPKNSGSNPSFSEMMLYSNHLWVSDVSKHELRIIYMYVQSKLWQYVCINSLRNENIAQGTLWSYSGHLWSRNVQNYDWFLLFTPSCAWYVCLVLLNVTHFLNGFSMWSLNFFTLVNMRN